MAPGRFITLEGGEGAGKTTQSALLSEALAARGVAVLRTREPGGSPGAELLRGILLGGSVDWAPRAETLLHFAARAEHVAKTIQPAIEAGTWVVCDRFFDSTLAYQGYGQGADRDFIASLIGLLGIAPDLTIVLDVADAVATERRRQRGGEVDRYERLDAAFHARVRQGFRDIAAADPRRCVLLDASGDIQAVHTAVMTAVGTL
ncbi:MAG: dTMP kinase, partial [Acetobacteraceae bacterium]|jgi:dTMP kinase|nr:dTMP kinase [Acetobacteraceae bacterium]MEA2768656.1 dTMP kinase [Acetobacteraceae bacterium]